MFFRENELTKQVEVCYGKSSPQRDHLQQLTGVDFIKNFAAPSDFFGQWKSYN